MPSETHEPTLSHVDALGAARMVDVSEKVLTARQACASAVLRMPPTLLDMVYDGKLPKGDAFAASRIAGVLAAKRTSDLIPLCHPLPLDWVRIEFVRTGPGELSIACTAKTTARTGVEMEAMVGAATAALTLYDMTKSADKGIVIGPIQLESKSGGKSGPYHRNEGGG